ncbi:hypothetical protein [Paenibacillus sp. CFBP13512]|uniref:hypothetical protein n=1 Tax=Paenibacillus sp. CFBP13512 TaxID=2184007 RepID=UPI0010BFB93B|nr:hypothetical protein [Paenibacillus sp. CFBP13512]
MKTKEKNTWDQGAHKVKNQPKYAKNIIVLVQYMKSYKWFVTDKEIWFLDFKKLISAYHENGFDIPNPNDFLERFNIPVVNEETAEEFLEKIIDSEVKVEELKNILKQDTHVHMLDMSPSLYINFDQKELISYYPEPASYELYVPDGWIGSYKDFIKDVPEIYCYWIIDGNNLFYR